MIFEFEGNELLRAIARTPPSTILTPAIVTGGLRVVRFVGVSQRSPVRSIVQIYRPFMSVSSYF